MACCKSFEQQVPDLVAVVTTLLSYLFVLLLAQFGKLLLLLIVLSLCVRIDCSCLNLLHGKATSVALLGDLGRMDQLL